MMWDNCASVIILEPGMPDRLSWIISNNKKPVNAGNMAQERCSRISPLSIFPIMGN